MKAYTHIIWDFNGTILNDVQLGIDSANRLLTAHGLPRIRSEEEYREKFGFPIIEYYRRMGFDFSATPYADLAVEWVAYYMESKKNATVFADIPEVLRKMKERGIPQIILSATEWNMLEDSSHRIGATHICPDSLQFCPGSMNRLRDFRSRNFTKFTD